MVEVISHGFKARPGEDGDGGGVETSGNCGSIRGVEVSINEQESHSGKSAHQKERFWVSNFQVALVLEKGSIQCILLL